MSGGTGVEYVKQQSQVQLVWGLQQLQSSNVCKLKENLNGATVKQQIYNSDIVLSGIKLAFQFFLDFIHFMKEIECVRGF
jgi:hypothetical protein